MDKDLTLTLGKVLGELYEIQKQQGINKVDNGHIYGLLHGFEEALKKEFENLNFISQEKVEAVSQYFSSFIKAGTETDDLPPFDSMRSQMEKQGMDQEQFITILRYLNASDRLNIDVNQLGNFELTSGDRNG
ncbi:hypothetical protein [Domibacillus iocasae]|uniref:Uncharacterized protein n=1 Tax=Domibacillus iocasae TaxID=1714016 RepID=A0A1E7DL88_9BACI|nr:hypothetical protein [Domibacillus iocasae]OES43852.1 hypothetical protein BA724_12220 [Domibacillus iocasae]